MCQYNHVPGRGRGRKGENMTKGEALALIYEELERAELKHPVFPRDPIHAVGIMYEERGEAMKEALDWTYANGNRDALEQELAHWGAMAVRCLINLHNFHPKKSEQG